MSTPDPREPRLPARAEALLEGWPAPARGALEWEESANAIITRVRDTLPGSTPDELLSPPLPEAPDESAARARAPETNPATLSALSPDQEPSLADIARAAVASSDAASKAVALDGLIAAELGRKQPPRELTPSPRAVASASVAELQGRVARVSPPARPAEPSPAMTAVAAEAGAPPFVEAAARSVHPAALADQRKRGIAPAVFGGATLAVAAAAALFISFERHREAPLSAATETHLAPTVPAQAAPEPAALAAAASAVTAAQSAVALDGLQPAPAEPESAASKAAAIPQKSLAFHVKKETHPSGGKLVLEETSTGGNAAPIAAEPPPAPTPAQAGVLAERPSTGAIQGAFGAVLTSARSCLAGQETGTRAIVTFEGATGRVKSVILDGPGAGSPAEPCVRAALMGARLSPFAEPSYTASVTVRPL